MGIQGASSVFFSLIILSLSHVFNAAKHLAEKWGHIGPLTIVIHLLMQNWLGFRGAPTFEAGSYTIAGVITVLKDRSHTTM